MPGILRVFIAAFTFFHTLGVARGDDFLWLRYRQAVEQIEDFECEYRLLSPPYPCLGLVAGRGAIDGGNGLLVEAKYAPFRWSAFRNRVYYEESRFEGNYYPPLDWQNRIIFYDGDTSGLYRAFQKTGEIRDAPPVEVGLFPNPASFLKPINRDLAAIEAAGDWMIPSHSDNRLELETKFGGFPWKYEIEIDPEHGFLPKSFKAIPLGAPMSYNKFINDEFQKVDGIWFPVKSRLEYYRGTALGPILETVRVVEVIPSTLRVNQGFTAKDFQFRFPENIHYENKVTGEVKESPEAWEYSRAFLSAPKRESLPATPMPSEVRKAWINRATWVTTGVFAVLTLMILAWNSRRILRWVGIATAGLVLTTLSGIGCGSHVSSDQASEIELAISELLRTETVAVDSEGVVESEFTIRNLGRNKTSLESLRMGCSCASASFSNSKSELHPGETTTLRILTRYRKDQSEVGHSVLFSARDHSNQTATFQVGVRVTRDSDWSIPFSPHLSLVANEPVKSFVDIRFSGEKPQDISVHNDDGIKCRVISQSALSDSTIRLEIEFLAHVPTATRWTEFCFFSREKNPMILKRRFQVAVEKQFGFSSSSFSLSSVPITLELDGASIASEIDYDSLPRGIISLELDPTMSGLIATREIATDKPSVVTVFARMKIDDSVYLRDCVVLVD